MIPDIAEVMDEYKRDIKPRTLALIKTMKAEYPQDWQRERRSEYLKNRMEDIILRTLYLQKDYDEAVATGNVDTRLYIGGQIVGAIKTVVALRQELIRLRKPDRTGDITQSDIDSARQYPWDQLLEFGRNRMARCPFHDDKTPSFSVHNGRGRCFGCHWKGDVIAFTMERDGLNFLDAVRRLR